MKKLWIGLALLSHCGILNASIDGGSCRQLSFWDPYPRVVRKDLGVNGQEFFYGLDCLKVKILAVFDGVVKSSGEDLVPDEIQKKLFSLMGEYTTAIQDRWIELLSAQATGYMVVSENFEEEFWKEEERSTDMNIVYNVIQNVLDHKKGSREFRMALLEAKEFFIESECSDIFCIKMRIQERPSIPIKAGSEDAWKKRHPFLEYLFGERDYQSEEYCSGIEELRAERERLNSRSVPSDVPSDLDEDFSEDDLFTNYDENGFFEDYEE